ncbi:MAG: hypothetical protein ACLVCH_04125 [Roseburia inulinivorans]
MYWMIFQKQRLRTIRMNVSILGELIIVFDGKKYKIGRGVNSLVTFTTEKTEDVRFIKIVEGMDLYMDDIRETYEENYVGKIINDYDGKQMFVVRHWCLPQRTARQRAR